MTARNDVDAVLDNIDEALMWEANWEEHAMRWHPDGSDPVERQRSPVVQQIIDLFAEHLNVPVYDYQAAFLERVYGDLESFEDRARRAIVTPRQSVTTIVFAFHDEEGLLRITQDPAEAAAAPGPISIGFDGTR